MDSDFGARTEDSGRSGGGRQSVGGGSHIDWPIVGQLLSTTTREPLSGLQVRIEDEQQDGPERIGTAFSELDGVFAIPLTPDQAEHMAGEDRRYALTVRNRFGRVVHRWQGVSGRRLIEPLEICIEVREEEDHPLPVTLPDPFAAFRQVFDSEIAVLHRAGIDTVQALFDLDIAAFSRRYELSHERLAAFRLAAHTGSPEQLSGEDARLLAAAGITSADELALQSPVSVFRAVNRIAQQRDDARPVDAERVVGWQMAARGWHTDVLSGHLNHDELWEAFQPTVVKLRGLSPEVSNFWLLTSQVGRLGAIAEMRGLMEAGGVHDLSSLGAFRIRGPHRITPGYHIALPKTFLSSTDAIMRLSYLATRGGGFAKVKATTFAGEYLHIAPNPVRDAVILGSVVDFLEGGKLIIGQEVAKLVVITDEIRYGLINAIEFEGKDNIPRTPAKVPDRPQVSRGGQAVNSPAVYVPGGNRFGRSGLRGVDGAPGRQGNNAEAAPSVTLFVKSVPHGLPTINLNGRRGGRGQDGQDGGHGEAGARGRESVSSAFWCETDVGSGGNGGDGGTGGQGGTGGAGGDAGTIKIFTTPPNLPRLLERQGIFIGITGGPGGSGGDGGGPGDGGEGGWVGHDTGWCDQDEGHAGRRGLTGAVGPRGEDGPNGHNGGFQVQPITEDDWNAAFTQPYLTRLEPSSGNAGQKIHVVGRNFTSLTKLMFAGQALTPDNVDIARGTMEFTVPPKASGGVKQVSLSVPVPASPVLRELSNAVNFRVLPQISALTPIRGLPGTEIQIKGSGISAGANVQFGPRTFPATVLASTDLQFTLPDFDTIGMTAGPQNVTVVNPDGQSSNSMVFELETEIIVRVKAWRVLDSDDDGTGRDADDIREIFDHEFSPSSIWDDHGILLNFDHNIGIARVSSDLADTWPAGGSPDAQTAKDQLLTPAPSGERYFSAGAINFYFVNDIDDWTTHAYADQGSGDTPDPPPVVIFEDTGWLSVEDEAHVAAHEIGHVFGLPHTCSKDDQDASGTTFGRVCNENSDVDYLMYPKTNRFPPDEGNALTPGEVKLAKSIARNLHRQ